MSARPLKRAPLPLSALRNTTELGQLLDLVVELDGEAFKLRPKKNALLQWSKSSKSLIVWIGLRTPRKKYDVELDAKQAKMYELWTAGRRSADSVRELDTPRMSGEWKRVGMMHEIGYRSDKFGPLRNYEHDFTSAVRLYAFYESSAPKLWVIRGGTLRVTRRGIEG